VRQVSLILTKEAAWRLERPKDRWLLCDWECFS